MDTFLTLIQNLFHYYVEEYSKNNTQQDSNNKIEVIRFIEAYEKKKIEARQFLHGIIQKSIKDTICTNNIKLLILLAVDHGDTESLKLLLEKMQSLKLDLGYHIEPAQCRKSLDRLCKKISAQDTINGSILVNIQEQADTLIKAAKENKTVLSPILLAIQYYPLLYKKILIESLKFSNIKKMHLDDILTTILNQFKKSKINYEICDVLLSAEVPFSCHLEKALVMATTNGDHDIITLLLKYASYNKHNSAILSRYTDIHGGSEISGSRTIHLSSRKEKFSPYLSQKQ